MSARILCSMCLRMAQPSRRDAVICSGCSIKLYARLAAATGEDIDGIALLDGIFKAHKVDVPADVAAGDGERVYANELFEVSHALD